MGNLTETLADEMNRLGNIIKANEREGKQEPHTYRCPDCQDTGEIGWTGPDGLWYGAPCKCQAARIADVHMERSGLHNLEEYTLEGFDARQPWQRKLKESANRYVNENAPGWFFVGGQVGCGKSHLCTGICAALIAKGTKARYESWTMLAQDLKVARRDTEFRYRMFETTNADVLYVDDFLQGRITKADQALAFEIIDARYKAGKPTIISTELFIRDVIDLNESIGSRIKEKTPSEFMNNVERDSSRNYRLKSS